MYIRGVRVAWTLPQFTAQSVDVALSFSNLLPADEVAALLSLRLQTLDTVAAQMDLGQTLKQQAVGHLPSPDAIIADVFDHNRRVVAAERAWAAHVLERVRAGAYLETDPEGAVEDGS